MDLHSKYFDRIRVRKKKDEEKARPAPQCQWDGCDKPGGHRAPVGRARENEFFNFCLEHVRQYNKGYNYFSGLSDDEVARYQKEALTGNRPTWSMGANSASRDAPRMSERRSGRGGFRTGSGAFYSHFHRASDEPPAQRRKPRPLEAKALKTLGLDGSATGEAVKARYKQLVKMHHPDANGGDRGSEDRFRDVILAYKLLRQSGFC